MNVVLGEINVVSILTVLAQFVLLVVFIVRSSERSIQAIKLAEQAQRTANEAKEKTNEIDSLRRGITEAQKCADSCKESIGLLNVSFSAYRESVAQNYISRDALKDESANIEKSIDNLGRYIEKLIDARGPIKDQTWQR